MTLRCRSSTRFVGGAGAELDLDLVRTTASLSCPADDELLRGAVALLVPLFDDDELLRGADALLVPVFDEEFALGPPMRLVRPDRVWLFGAGIRAPGVEVPAPDGGTGSAEELDVLRVSAMHACLTPPSTPPMLAPGSPPRPTESLHCGIPCLS
jgi:hypothetical protein